MTIIETRPKCGHDLLSTVICTIPPIPRKECPACGWCWEGKTGEIIRVPFGKESLPDSDEQYLAGMKAYIRRLKELPQDEARHKAREALIRTGVLNEDGTPKENIVTR